MGALKGIIMFFEAQIHWLNGKLTHRQLLIFSGTMVGFAAGLAAVVLKTLVHYIQLGFTYDYNLKYQYWLYLLGPVIGIFFTVWFIRNVLRNRFEKGTSGILLRIYEKSAFLPRNHIYSHLVTSALTVGMGGSAGLESPMVSTGAAMGSNYAERFGLNYADRVMLLACGAAAGIAAAFNAPIAGVLFALEVLLIDIRTSAFIPLIISAAAGALCSKVILNENILLSFSLQEPFNYGNLPFYLLLGILTGLVSVYYTRTFRKIEHAFARSTNVYGKVLAGGLILAILIMFFPTLFGEGYSSIKSLANMEPEKLMKAGLLNDFRGNSWFVLCFVAAAMLLKVVATAVTLGSGGNGGNFGPALFVGSYLGYVFSEFINKTGLAKLPVSNFTLVAMAGILAGVFHAPLMGIFLIAELTHGYELMIPLMIVSAVSFAIVKYFEPFSLDARAIAEAGHLQRHKDKSILSSMEVSQIVETDFHTVSPEDTLGQLVEVISRSRRNIFPVVDDKKRLVGIIQLDKIRNVLFKTEMHETVLVKELMVTAPAVISLQEDMNSVMKKFDETSAWNLPVTENNAYKGFISKSTLLSAYRNHLIKNSIEN
jgi:CIC family chloride channel protein